MYGLKPLKTTFPLVRMVATRGIEPLTPALHMLSSVVAGPAIAGQVVLDVA
jgi:hypothetical protein